MTVDNLAYQLIENQEDVDSTISFLNSVLDHTIDNAIWEWEFNSIPNDPVLTIIKDKNDTVGTQFMLPIPVDVKGTEAISGKCESSYFHPKYRGKGLFQKLFSFAEKVSVEQKIELLWAFTPAIKVYEQKLNFTVFTDAMYNFSTTVGKRSIGHINSYTNSIYKACLKYIYHWPGYALFKARNLLFSFRTKYSKRITEYRIVSALSSFEDIDKLYNNLKLQHDNFVHIKIDKPYFDWRIKNNVNLNYVTNYFYQNDDLVGYYIFSVVDHSANISDFTSLNQETSNVMICHLLEEVSKLKLLQLNYFGNLKNDLNRNNFKLFQNFGGKIHTADDMPFVFKDISDGNHDSAFLGLSQNWYLNGLWTEGFRY